MAGAGLAMVRRHIASRRLATLRRGAAGLRPFRLVLTLLLFANTVLAVSAALSIRAVADEVPDCSIPRSSLRAGSGLLDLLPRDHWQPRGGRIDFRAASPKDIPPSATVLACFGWLYQDAASAISFDSRPSWIIEPDRSISGTVTVPDLPPAPPRWSGDSFRDVGVYSSFWLVPMAKLRILVLAPDGNVLFDSQVNVGISDKRMAGTTTSILVALSFFLLWPIRTITRLEQPFPLWLICNRARRASLSYFQILLVTIVLTAALSYLILVSGELVGLPTSAFTILLISASTTLLSRWHTEHAHLSQGPQSAPQLARPERRAKWRDLIASQDDQWSTIDVTRLQMLVVTLLTAFIIVKRIANEPTFPEKLDSVLLLFAVSNGIYLAGKFAAVSKSVVEFASLVLVEKGVRRVLAPPPLVNYDGYLVCRITMSSGVAKIDADRTYLVPNFQSCQMELQLQPASGFDAVSAQILVEQGEPQSVPRDAIFQVEMNCDDLEPQSKFFEIKGRTGVSGPTEHVHLERPAMQPPLVETAIRIILSQGGRVVQFLSVRLREERNGYG